LYGIEELAGFTQPPSKAGLGFIVTLKFGMLYPETFAVTVPDVGPQFQVTFVVTPVELLNVPPVTDHVTVAPGVGITLYSLTDPPGTDVSPTIIYCWPRAERNPSVNSKTIRLQHFFLNNITSEF
jgi:hypothetical protein